MLIFANQHIRFVKLRQRKTLSGWLTSNYLFVIRDYENFAEIITLRFTPARVFLLLGVFFALSVGLSFLLVTTVLSRWFDPRTESLKTNRTLLELEARVDSLTFEIAMKDRWLVNFQNVLQGNVSEAQLEQIRISDSVDQKAIGFTEIQEIDSQFRKKFEEVDYEKLTFINSTQENLRDMFFFSPIVGVISRPFNVKERHYGIDIVAKKNEPIKSLADGTVILSSWTQDSGYVIAVQHKNQLISFYKHNSVLLKNVGETVKAGDILALIGNSGEYTDGPHLHFELWYNGNPVDPEDFVTF